MEKASIKLAFLTLFVIAIAVAVVPIPKVEARELQQTLRIPVVLEVEVPQEPLSMPAVKMEAEEFLQLTLSKQPNQCYRPCNTNADCTLRPFNTCRKGCCEFR